MGIDKPNVRFTLNINHSGSLEGYVQEAGRAGRDRKMALSTIMYCPQEFSEQNERTRIYEAVPVDYGVHQFFYENNFIGADFEKWIMYFLMSKNTNTIVEVGEEQKNVESVSGFLDKLMLAQPEEELVYYISYTYTAEDVRWINEMLTKTIFLDSRLMMTFALKRRVNEDTVLHVQRTIMAMLTIQKRFKRQSIACVVSALSTISLKTTIINVSVL